MMIDTDRFFAADAEGLARKREVEKLQEELKEHMSPPGALGLPPLLDQRRLEYGLPDEIFNAACMYEFIHIYQIDLVDTDKFSKDSLLVRPEALASRDKKTAHRGILVGAGLRALDIGRSNGWDLGHIVNFIQLAPFRQKMVTIRGKDWSVLCMQAGDIRSSEDLVRDLRGGRAKVRLHELPGGGLEHRLETSEGNSWKPASPWIADDM